MTYIDKEELKETVRKAVNEIIREENRMPTPVASPEFSIPVTEIIIRTGAPGAVQMLGSGRVSPVSTAPPIYRAYDCDDECVFPPIGYASEKRLQSIQAATGEPPKQVIRKLGLQLMGEQLEKRIEEYEMEVQQAKGKLDQRYAELDQREKELDQREKELKQREDDIILKGGAEGIKQG